MAEYTKSTAASENRGSREEEKKLYEPPKVVAHNMLEVVAVACTNPAQFKTNPLEGTCYQQSS